MEEKILEKIICRKDIFLDIHTSLFLKIEFDNGWMAINPGSRGSRDGDNRASYAVLIQQIKKFFNRVIYSISTVIEQCKNTGFPEKIWRSLEAGKWISDKTEGGVE